VTIVGGDGHANSGVVTPNNQGDFDVTASNCYYEEGSYPVTVQLVEKDSGGTVPRFGEAAPRSPTKPSTVSTPPGRFVGESECSRTCLVTSLLLSSDIAPVESTTRL
jgi:hypothetical protein